MGSEQVGPHWLLVAVYGQGHELRQVLAYTAEHVIQGFLAVGLSVRDLELHVPQLRQVGGRWEWGCFVEREGGDVGCCRDGEPKETLVCWAVRLGVAGAVPERDFCYGCVAGC